MKVLNKIIQKLFCCHEWTKVEEIDEFDKDNSIRPHTIHYVYICKKCGKIKTIKIRATKKY